MQTINLSSDLYLDRNNYKPLYLQLAQQIFMRIRSGEYQPGEKLPPELELSKQLGVSRITIRQAMENLIDKGCIYREQGRGTYIAQPLMQNVRGFTSFTEDMRSRGLQTTSKVLWKELAPAGEDVCKKMNISQTEKVIRLKRLRFVEGIPWAIQISTLISSVFPGLEKEDLNGSLFSVLREKYHVYPTWTEAKVMARIADTEETNLLDISENSAVLVVEGLSFTDSFDIVESVVTIYNGSVVSLHMGRQRLG